MKRHYLLAAAAGSLITLPTESLVSVAQAHHSFASFDTRTVTVLTGVVSRVDPAPNHLQVFFAPMRENRKGVERKADGQPFIWSVEMEPSGLMADQGLSVNSFPAGTVFSIGLHPLRNGDPAGVKTGGIIKCPERTPPPPGKHCDAVPGHVRIGTEELATPDTEIE